MKRFFKLALAVILLALSNNAFAWGTTGHRVVAEIADQHLSCKAKRQIKNNRETASGLLGELVRFYQVRPCLENGGFLALHKFPGGLSREQFDKNLLNSSDENLYKRALLIMDELKNHKNLSRQKKQEDLYFLIHLIGDAHQPLHAGREEDLGGNKIQVEWFREPTNLHSLWDSKLIDFQNYSYSEYANVLDFHDKKFNKQLTEGDLNDWMFDSYQKSENIYANAKNGDKLSYKYNYDNVSVLEEQLLKGGLRLAKVLNEVFR